MKSADTIMPSEPAVAAFWRWFESVAFALADDVEQRPILERLDEEVAKLGSFGWEVGPGVEADNMLVISPDGRPERLALTRRVVSMAPSIPRWEFHSAKPPRPTMQFVMGDGFVPSNEIDARSWRYVLFKFPEGVFDIVIEQVGLNGVSDDVRYAAAGVVLDGVLGEASRLQLFREIEPVGKLTADMQTRASSIVSLATHIQSLQRN
jgi:hypothetical protein